jgi:16S rRNA (cytosine967-C5)-methyltransferase
VHPAVTVLLENAGVHFESPKAIGHTSITDKATQVAQWLKLPAPPLLPQLEPPWLPDALACPAPDFAKCVTAFQQRPPTWLRVADGHTDTVITALGASGIEVTRHPRMPLALAVPGTSGLAQLDHAIKTRFEIQDLASQSVGLVCSPQAGERWWDICAGSGGKSLHLADVTKNHGTIYATDVRESALDELRRRAKRAGATCIKVGVEPDELVHGVLVDAPCSGIGTWSRNPDARWRTTMSAQDQRFRRRFCIARPTVSGPAVRSYTPSAHSPQSRRPASSASFFVCDPTSGSNRSLIR